MMANITRKPNGTFLIRVSNGMKNGKQDLVSTIYKPPVGSTSAMARKAAEKYAVLFEELVHSGGYEKKQAISREIRARRRMTIEQFVQNYYYPSIQKHLSPTTCRTYELIIDSLILPSFGRVELEDVDSTHRFKLSHFENFGNLFVAESLNLRSYDFGYLQAAGVSRIGIDIFLLPCHCHDGLKNG